MDKNEYFDEEVDYNHSETTKTPLKPLQRETDSLEDFEHLEHCEPVRSETVRGSSQPPLQIDLSAERQPSASLTSFDSVHHQPSMDSNLLDLDNPTFPPEKDDKMDKFLDDLSSMPSPMLPSKFSPTYEEKQDLIKAATEDFVASEKIATGDAFYNVKQDLFTEPTKIEAEKDAGHSKPTIPVVPPPVLVQPKPEEKKSEATVMQKSKPPITEAEAMFKKMGLDTWFSPERLNPKVESLIYWRDPKKSGPVFGGVLVVLLSLTCFSLITVLAYLSLFTLSVTLSFRIYKNVVQAIQKTGDGHPFKEYLEKDVFLPQDKAKEVVEVAIPYFNIAVMELRRIFLVEDLVDSIKFAGFLWCLTYVGSWFNGMTLVILAWVALFTLPKVYETNKVQIDANLDVVRTKFAEITSKVKAAIPIGKKSEDKKEQ